MKTRLQKCFFSLTAALVFNLACEGQYVFQAQAIEGDAPQIIKANVELTITGTVFDASGAPAPGVVMVLAPSSLGANLANLLIKTDDNGKYKLEWRPRPINANAVMAQAPIYSLIARELEHNFAASHTVDETTTKLDLHLQPGLTLSVKVEDPGGKPVTNAAGSLIIYSGNSGVSLNRPPSATSADDQGRIQFNALPQGHRYSITIRAAGFGSSRQQMIRETDTQTNRLDLPNIILNVANLKLAGRVLGVGGQPVPGVRVTVTGVGQPTTNTLSDDSGHFTLNVCEGPVNVNASVQGANGRAQATGGDTNVEIKLSPNPNVQFQFQAVPAPVVRPPEPPPYGMVAPRQPPGVLKTHELESMRVLRCFQWNSKSCLPTPCQGPCLNPEGIGSFSPGLDRVGEGLPWVAAINFLNPERVESQSLRQAIQPFQGCVLTEFSPRVVRSSQPWAESYNPFGIG
jgi:protocatechuate 3,4-dioxygenase beta subunit